VTLLTTILDAATPSIHLPTTLSTRLSPLGDNLVDRLLDRLATRLADEPSVPAVYLHGLDHHQVAQILHADLPAVVHRRRVYTDRDEHLVLDTVSGEGARVELRWHSSEHQVLATVAETPGSLLYQRLVICLTGWDLAGRIVPSQQA
jgi:hypothetical protein